MRRLGRVAMVLAMTAAAAGCGGDGGDEDGGDSASATTRNTAAVPAAPSTVVGTTVPPTNLTLRITDIRLVGSEEPDRGMRVLLPAGVTTAAVTLLGLPSPNRDISVCQAPDLSGQLNSATCRTPANGESVTVALGGAGKGVEVVHLGGTSTGPVGSSAVLEEATIRYAASAREVTVRLPQIAAGESGGRPTFSLTPPSEAGTYQATLSWTIIPVFGGAPSNGQLELLQGGVASQTQSGGGEVRLNGSLPAPVADVALRVQNIGGAALVTPRLTATLP